MALLEGERQKLKEDLVDMGAEGRQCLEKAQELLDRAATEIEMARMLQKRANLLAKMSKNNEILIWGKDTFFGRIKAKYNKWKEQRPYNDGYPGI